MTLVGVEHQTIAALRKITRAIDVRSRELVRSIGLTTPQVAALEAIARLQPVTMGELARSIHLSQATLSGVLFRLESRRLVARTRSESDRRNVVVQLTEEGQSALKTAPSLLPDRFRVELEKMREWEQLLLVASLERVASMMDVAVDPDDGQPLEWTAVPAREPLHKEHAFSVSDQGPPSGAESHKPLNDPPGDDAHNAATMDEARRGGEPFSGE